MLYASKFRFHKHKNIYTYVFIKMGFWGYFVFYFSYLFIYVFMCIYTHAITLTCSWIHTYLRIQKPRKTKILKSQSPLPVSDSPDRQKIRVPNPEAPQGGSGGAGGAGGGGEGGALEGEEALKFGPNPDMLLSKLDDNAEVSVGHRLTSSSHKTRSHSTLPAPRESGLGKSSQTKMNEIKNRAIFLLLSCKLI